MFTELLTRNVKKGWGRGRDMFLEPVTALIYAAYQRTNTLVKTAHFIVFCTVQRV
jgi:hypothetical protein